MVTIYTKERCINCDKSKLLMKRLGIAYKEISLEHTPGALDEVLSMGFQAAPVIVSAEDKWSGFNETKIRSITPELDDVWA